MVVEYPTAHLLLVSNNPYELRPSRMAGARRARLDLGTLGVVSARIAGPKEAVTFVGLEAHRPDTKLRRVARMGRSPASAWTRAAPVRSASTARRLLMEPPLVFESRPGALRVRIPTHAPGSSPAATSVPTHRLDASGALDPYRGGGRAVGTS